MRQKLNRHRKKTIHKKTPRKEPKKNPVTHKKKSGPLGWFDLPAKVRNQIIGDMDFETRMTFFVCSELSLLSMPDNCITSVSISFFFIFYLGDRKRILWGIGQFVDFPKMFQKLVQKNSSSLTSIHIDDNFWDVENTTIKELKNLTDVYINFCRPADIDSGFTDFEQLSQIRDSVGLKNIKISFDNLIQFNAVKINLYKVITSSKDVNMYLKYFASGQIKKRIKELSLKREERSRYDLSTVIKGLEIYGRTRNSPGLLLKHLEIKLFKGVVKEAGKKFFLENETFRDGCTSFALVSSEVPCRIAVIQLSDDDFSMKVYPKRNFEQDAKLMEQYGKFYGEDLVESFEVLDLNEVPVSTE